MISNNIRAWKSQQKQFPSVFLYHNTTTGIFTLTEVEAEITEPLLPLEQLSLALIGYYECVTRIELHAFSGITVSICQETLDSLHLHGLIEIRDYDNALLQANIDSLKVEIGDDWYTPYIKEMTKRKLLKQYVLSKTGKQSLKDLNKTVIQTRDLSLIVTGNPFYVFYDKFDIRSDGFEMVDMDPNLTKHLLGHTEKFAPFTGIKPLAIGPNTISEGKEVSNSQFWITLEGDPKDHIDEIKSHVFLTSRSFDRWADPSWTYKIQDILNSIGPEYIEDFIIRAMSETWMMVDDVIEEGLKLSSNKVTWTLETDLEMQKLIFNAMPEPIAKTESEIKLRLPNSSWRLVILLRIEPYDDLAQQSLAAGRFHQIASRKGFTLEEGYLDYTEMMREWKKDISRKDYIKTLESLVKHGCLIERFPDINSIFIDVDDILGDNRRETQNWQFSRLRELDQLMMQNDIHTVQFCATTMSEGKIDEAEAFKDWVDQGKIKIVSNDGGDIPQIIEMARNKKAHYLGSKLMMKGKKKQEYGRMLEYFVTKKRIHVPGLEPFYDWQMENIFDKLYQVHYE